MMSPGACGLFREDFKGETSASAMFVPSVTPSQCAYCNGGIPLHPPRLQPKREREEKKPSTFRFTCKFIKGARCIDLRRAVYAQAQKMLAFDGKIEYLLPKGKKIIDGDCDLDVELFFKEERDALQMRNYATEASKLWCMEHPPKFAVEECEHVCKNAVMESDYDKRTSPSREKIDGQRERQDSGASPTHATTVIDQ